MTISNLFNTFRNRARVYTSGQDSPRATKPDAVSPDWILEFVRPESEIAEKLEKDPLYKAFLECVFRQLPDLAGKAHEVSNPRAWRNLAMSVAQDQSQLVYRFTFISLLNLGVATALICVGLVWIGLHVLKAFEPSTEVADLNLALVLFFVTPYFFLDRYYSFNRRAFQVPFSMALSKLAFEPSKEGKSGAQPSPFGATHVANKRGIIVYLAGGFRSGWQETVMQAAPKLTYVDPRSHNLQAKEEYCFWDLEALRSCNYVFAYLESTNPGGFALAMEVGYAKALGKKVILVDEKSAAGGTMARHLEMLTAASDVSFQSLPQAIEFLQKLEALSQAAA